MMEALAARIGLKLSGAAIIAIMIALFLALAGLGAWRAMAAFHQEIEDARAAAIRERDAHWKAEIEKSNSEAEARRVDQAIAAAQQDAVSRAKIEALEDGLKDMETRNAEMPEGTGGLKRDRVRLLPR